MDERTDMIKLCNIFVSETLPYDECSKYNYFHLAGIRDWEDDYLQRNSINDE